ncbi:transposase [Acidithiobacillus ferridurans]|uniref:transposase n=1 Tax=Acidithiobacillus ferridurans TaxID=1232575 RepID=UPI00384EC5EB
MSSVIKVYKNSSFAILFRVSTVTKNEVSLPEGAAPAMEDAAKAICRKQKCRFVMLDVDGSAVHFEIEIHPGVRDIGQLVGVIKSTWSRLLCRDFGLPQGLWLPRYILLSKTSVDIESVEKEWLERIRESFAEKDKPTEEPTDAN